MKAKGLISVFVFTNAKSRFSYHAARMLQLDSGFAHFDTFRFVVCLISCISLAFMQIELWVKAAHQSHFDIVFSFYII